MSNEELSVINSTMQHLFFEGKIPSVLLVLNCKLSLYSAIILLERFLNYRDTGVFGGTKTASTANN